MNENDAKTSGGNADDSGQKSPPTLPAISLPKGGGAIRDIGEKFSVNAATGTGSMTIPIYTSPGRSAFSPIISLNYSSGNGNGPFALGWHLSIPSVTRKTEKGLPLYNDATDSDVFILSDAEDLMPTLSLQNNRWLPVPVPDATLSGQTYAIKQYRPRTESLFARIERWQRKSDGDLHWRAITKDNVTSLYGQSPFCRLSDPADNSRVFQWLLETTFDDKGSSIFYQYKAEDATGINSAAANERNRQNGNAPYTNLYLKRVFYGNHTPYLPSEDLSKRTDWLFEVVLDYGEHDPVNPTPAEDPTRKWLTRADPFSSFRSTFDIRTYRLCQRVLMFHHIPTGSGGGAGYDGLVRSTDFIYDQADPSSPLQGNPTATKLQSITQSGYSLQAGNGATPSYLKKTFPPIEFGYSEATIHPAVQTVDSGSLKNLPSGLDGSSYQWVDIDGEGLSGILTQQATSFFYKRNLSPLSIANDGSERAVARFGQVELLAPNPVLAQSGSRPQFMSLAADGHQDLVNFSSPMRGVYRRSDEPGWEGFRPFCFFPNLNINDPNLKFLDVDGDGLTDLLISEDEVLSWHRSFGEAGFGPREYVRKPFDEERGPALVFADPDQSMFTADMTGDGLIDIVRIRNGEVCYWPNLGYGRFGAKITMDASPYFDTPDLFDSRRIRLGDIDGSGTTDLLYLAADNVAIYLNQSGNSFADQELLPGGFPATSHLTSVNVLDLLGNGTACLVWSSPLPSDSGRQMRYIDLMGGVKPHLLLSTTNNMGAETRVRYASSTKFYVEDRAAGTPWITKLPFPVYVVEKTEVFDYIGKTRFSTSYRYRHGYFDGIEREFRGFGYVEQSDAEAFGESESLFTQDTGTETDAVHVPPVITKTWFHTGAWPNGQSISQQMAHEYFSAFNEGPLLPDTILPVDIFLPQVDQALNPPSDRLPYSLTGEEQREALRNLKGGILRQEIYAADGTAKATTPYSISERNYTVECLQPQAGNRYAVFFKHARETIDYHLERNPADPRVSHSAVLSTDIFGNILQAISAGYGRNLASASVQLAPSSAPGTPPDLTVDASTFAQSEQLTTLLTLTANTVTNSIDTSASYRTPLPSESQTYELTRPVRPDDSLVYSFSDLQILASTAAEIAYEVTPDPALIQKRLVTDVRTLYLSDDLSGPLAPGQIGSLGLVYQTYQLAITSNLAQQVLVTDNSNPNKPTDAASLNTILSGVGGYVNSQGDSDWWIPSGQILYSPVPTNPPGVPDPAFAAAHFYLPQAHCDAFGQYTRFSYDSFNLLLQQTQDALGNIVSAQSDYRVLQPQEIIDPNSNHSEVVFDALGMVVGTAVKGKVTPPNPSESGDSFATFITDLPEADIENFIGNANPIILAAGLLGTATTRIIYDLDRFSATQTANPTDLTKWEPIFAATLARETHVSDLLPAGQSLKIQVSFSYSDGLGREIQKKIQAEPGPLIDGGPIITPRWVGTGWIILNNKGKPVRQYEPFFSSTQDFEFEFANLVGVSTTLFYDPVLRVVLTLQPDNTYAKVLFDPWRQESWDANDTVNLDPRTDPDVIGLLGDYFQSEPANWQTWLQQRLPDPQNPPQDSPSLPADQAAAVRTLKHAGTSTATCFDNLGRAVLTVANNGLDTQGQPQFYSTRTELDIQGNQLSVTDTLGRKVVIYDYGQLKNLLHQSSMEAGQRWMVNNVLGKMICTWDSRGFQRVGSYDELQRPIALNITGNGWSNLLAEKTIYGDSKQGGPTNPQLTNHRGKAYQIFDAAGVVTTLGLNPSTSQNEGYDFKGNLLRSSRQLLAGASYKSSVNWNQNPALAEVFASSTRFDALNRPVALTTPDASIISPIYNDANLLEQLNVNLLGAANVTPFITNIGYNAKGQRLLIEYGNGARTDYTYDSETFRLINLRTDQNVPLPSLNPGKLQNLAYTYDPVGNITRIEDAAQQTIYFNNQVVTPSNDYTYDAIYRLLKAAGREHLGQTGGVPNASTPQSYNDWPNLNLPHPNDGKAMGLYLENFGYDPVGNIQQVQHLGSNPVNPGWRRSYTYAEPSLIEPTKFSNRLSKTTVGQIADVYSYDPHGNMLGMAQLQAMQWDFKDQLQVTQRQAVNNQDVDGTNHQGERTYYVYDSGGQRLRKVTETAKGTKKNERIYLGGFEVYREYTAGSSTPSLERQTLHVMDDKQRLALVETLSQGDDGSPPQLLRFQFGNQLGSACLELDEVGDIISYEEYYPYGATSYQATDANTQAAAKRYRFTGKERDEETGFNYHGARHYASWLGRWTSCDPQGLVDGLNVYRYGRSNPIVNSDSTGMAANNVITIGAVTIIGFQETAEEPLTEEKVYTGRGQLPEEIGPAAPIPENAVILEDGMFRMTFTEDQFADYQNWQYETGAELKEGVRAYQYSTDENSDNSAESQSAARYIWRSYQADQDRAKIENYLQENVFNQSEQPFPALTAGGQSYRFLPALPPEPFDPKYDSPASIGDGPPMGFGTGFGFPLFSGAARAGLNERGLVAEPFFQGSSVTGYGFVSRLPFDVGRTSDFDLALVSPTLLARAGMAGFNLRSARTRTGPLTETDEIILGLEGYSSSLSVLANRPVNLMVYGNTTALQRAPSIRLAP